MVVKHGVKIYPLMVSLAGVFIFSSMNIIIRITTSLMAILFFTNADAQFKFHTPVVPSVEVTLINMFTFKDIFELDRQVMRKNKVMRISYFANQAELIYSYNEKAELISHSTIVPAAEVIDSFSYDANGRITQWASYTIFNSMQAVAYWDYKYDDSDNLIEVQQTNTLFKTPQVMKINYLNNIFPHTPFSIRSSSEMEESSGKTLTEYLIEADDEGRITAVKVKDENAIEVTYPNTGVNIIFAGTNYINYTIEGSLLKNITNKFTSVDFSYNAEGLIEYSTTTNLKKQNQEKVIFIYEFY